MGLSYLTSDSLESIPGNLRDKIKEKIEWLWENRKVIHHDPLGHNLAGYYKYPFRKKYRIIYSYNDNPDEMIIMLADHRDKIYKRF